MFRSTITLYLLLATPLLALEPGAIAVVANKDSKASLKLAAHYLAARKVPKENLIELSLPTTEDISRKDYDAKLAGPLREALKDKKDSIELILCLVDVPLRVGPKDIAADDKPKLDKLKVELAEAKKAAEDLSKAKPSAEAAKLTAAQKLVAELDTKVAALSGDQSVAAVDSELMLLWWPKYELSRWIINPLFWQLKDSDRKKSPRTLMTCRLDGPTPEIAQRLVDDAIEVEATGLTGKVYIDARGQKFDVKNKAQWTGYQGYDEGFREAAELLKGLKFEATLDDAEPVFAAKTCPDAALYAGWYSHAKYVESCTFAKGAVAYHLASSEATTLRKKDSKVWCPNLLKAGVAATMGPVAEPYTVAFPKASEFFGFLVTGELTLAECFARTTILTSWQMTLVGDPLYNPFKKTPKMKSADVKPSPWGQGK